MPWWLTWAMFGVLIAGRIAYEWWKDAQEEKASKAFFHAEMARLDWRKKAIQRALDEEWPHTDLHYPDGHVEHIELDYKAGRMFVDGRPSWRLP